MVYLPSNGLIETVGSTRNMHWSALQPQLSTQREGTGENTKMIFNVVDGTYIMVVVV